MILVKYNVIEKKKGETSSSCPNNSNLMLADSHAMYIHRHHLQILFGDVANLAVYPSFS